MPFRLWPARDDAAEAAADRVLKGAVAARAADGLVAGAVTLPCEERDRLRLTDFQADAMASRHVVIAAARSTRRD